MSQTMETMPGEILLHISSYLADTHTASLLAFGLVNRRYFSIAKSFLFRTIKFELLTHDRLVRDIQECQKLLERNAGFEHVRRIVVDIVPAHARNDSEESDSPPNFEYHRWQRPRIAVEDEHGEQPGVEAKSHHFFHDFHADEELSLDWLEDSTESLARLIERLPLLSDLVYGSPSKFPRRLLQTLHSYQPQCRLRIKRFMLRSLDAPVMDPDEFMLVTSPCLHAVKIGYGCAYYPDTDSADYNLEAAMSVVAGQAPNLKEVGMWSEYCPVGLVPQQESWEGFAVDEEMKRKMNRFALGSLQRLQINSIACPSFPKDTALQRWATHTDFSVLQVLELSSPVGYEALEFLANCELPDLVHLSLSLIDSPISDYYVTLGDVLSSLSPQLSGLVLTNWLPPSEPECSMPFGPNLRQLWLHSERGTLQPEGIARLAERSPLIEDLSLHVPRSKGDAAEVAFYRVLGRLRRLRHLSLFLDTVIPWDPDDCWQHSKHGKDRTPEHVPVYGPHEPDPWLDPKGTARARDMLVNSAVDEDLALAIFQVISSAKRHPLQSLRLSPLFRKRENHYCHNRPITRQVWPYLHIMKRDWLVERNDDGGVSALLLRPDRNWPAIRNGRGQVHPDLLLSQTEVVDKAFRRLWPGATDSGWADEWRSWPLADVGHEEDGDGEGTEV